MNSPKTDMAINPKLFTRPVLEPTFDLARGVRDIARPLSIQRAEAVSGDITAVPMPPAHKNGAVADEHLQAALDSMMKLNRGASLAARTVGPNACTDVTGFGLLGHLRNMTAASGVTAEVWADRVPVLPAAREYVGAGIAPGGTRANRAFLADWVEYAPDVPESGQLLLCDAQTSGGLLIAGEIPGAPVIGELVAGGQHTIVVR